MLSVLSRRGGLEGPEVDSNGIPASTFYAVRRKIYSSGWLSDRFVPNPWAVGAAFVDFSLMTPGPMERARVEEEFAASPSTVVLWSGLDALFAVSFRTQGDAPTIGDGSSLSIGPSSGSIPVYFDYSRPWSRFVGIERDTGYPRALGRALPPGESTSLSKLYEALAVDSSDGGDSPRAHPWHSPVAVSRTQQRLLERNSIESRTLLNVDRLPPFNGRVLGEIVLLSGERLEGVTPAQVLGTLHNECSVSPVLFADDGEKLLIVALGQLAAGTLRRAKIPRATAHVAAALGAALSHLKMVVERTDSVRIVVDHRYDRLIQPGTEPRQRAGPPAER